MSEYKTEQEKFWSGDFGTEYIERNNDQDLVSPNISFFSKLFSEAQPIKSVIEFGSNIGMNLRAIKTILPAAELSAIEINDDAAEQLKLIDELKIYHESILDFKTDYPRDLTFIKGVLIHINPEQLKNVYRTLYETSSRYICIAEYYNPVPVELEYRGHSGRLFKRDFAGELMDQYPDLSLVSYGFCYHRDPVFPQDDVTWFLMEKNS